MIEALLGVEEAVGDAPDLRVMSLYAEDSSEVLTISKMDVKLDGDEHSVTGAVVGHLILDVVTGFFAIAQSHRDVAVRMSTAFVPNNNRTGWQFGKVFGRNLNLFHLAVFG